MRWSSFVSTFVACITLSACVQLEGPNTQGNPVLPTVSPPTEQFFEDTNNQAVALEQLEKLDGAVATGSSAVQFLDSGITMLGSTEAPLTLTVFTEYNCLYCKQFQNDYIPRLMEDFIVPGHVRIRTVIRPFEKYETGSSTAALAQICAGSMGKPLSLHQELFGLETINRNTIVALAKEQELEETEFLGCLDALPTQELLEAHKKVASALGVDLAPTFFLNGEQKTGLLEYADLRGWIEQKLTKLYK